MRFFFKTIMMLVIMLGVSSYGSYLMTGRPLWEVFKLPAGAEMDFTPEMPEIPDSVSGALPAEKEKIYKWRDADGVMQYSSHPPTDGTAAQSFEVDPDANVIAGTRMPESGAAEAGDASDSAAAPAPPAGNRKSAGNGDGEAPPLYSPQGVKQLMDDARNVQKQLEERDRARRRALENM